MAAAIERSITAADLQPGMQTDGYLPAVAGLRTTGCQPIVKCVQRRDGWIVVTWIDDTQCNMHPDEQVEIVAPAEEPQQVKRFDLRRVGGGGQ